MQATTVEELFDIYQNGSNEDWWWASAPDEVWLELVSAQPEMRLDIAGNKTIGEPVIRVLAKDEDSDVRWRIAMKRATPEDVMLDLAGDPDEVVRQRIALNPKVTQTVLEALVEDDWEPVRKKALERLAALRAAEDSE